ncbi:MAG: copper resistance CopC family protein [Pseudonocardiaceae bacterium]
MTPKPSRAVALRSTTQWARASVVTLAAALLALMLPLGPMVADAATPGSAHSGVSARGDGNGAGHADLAVAVHTGNLFAMHNELLSTVPPEGAQLSTGPARVILTFDLPAQRGFSTIIITGPDGNQWQAGPATEDGTTVSAPVRPLGPAGDYTVAWRIISADGHPVRATLKFTLTTPGPGTAAPNAGRSGGPTLTTEAGSGSTWVWPWVAGVGALLLAGVVVALRTRRTRR